VPRLKVLFVCLANCIRSQMAEGFARAHGGDVLSPSSAGLAPAGIIAPLARRVMSEKDIDMETQFSKGLDEVDANGFDLIINMSGLELPPHITATVRDWNVSDPVGEAVEAYREAAALIERRVSALIEELRARGLIAAEGESREG